MIVGSAEMADLLGFTTRRVSQLAKEGIVVRVAPGKFDATATIKNMLHRASAKHEAEEAMRDLDRERARLAREQADGHQLKNAALRRELLPREKVEAEWSNILRKVRAGMLAVPSRVRQRVGLNAADADAIDREIRDALTALGNDRGD